MDGEKLATSEGKEKGTAEEPTTKYRGWKAMPYVIGNETFEKLGTIGTSSNLLVYLTKVFHMNSVTAAALLNLFNGTTNLAPLLGAFVSDTYMGRFLTLGLASISSITGMLILTLTAAVPQLHPKQCEPGSECGTGPSTLQFAVLLSAFSFLVVGAGGIRPCNLAFGADQFDPATEAGRQGINSFFNWYYFTFTFAIMASSTLIIYVQTDVSWALGLAIPTLLMLLSCALFFAGSKIYVKVGPNGSPFTSVARVLVAAFLKRGLELASDLWGPLFDPPHASSLNSRLPRTDQFRFLDKAAVITAEDIIRPNTSGRNSWRLCSLQQIEEVKCLFRILSVWSSVIVYNVAMVQQSTYVVYQALQSDRHLGDSQFEIPAASFTVFSMLTLTLWIPIYDRVIVPRLTRLTGQEGGITVLQRIGIGLILGVIAMIASALVEDWRRSYALYKPIVETSSSGGAISSMSSLWLIPQLSLLGLSDAFSAIGQVEFYYKQFPENMRSFAGALVFFGAAISNYLSGLMVMVIRQSTGRDGRESWLAADLNKGRLDKFYFLIAILGVMNFLYFVMCARWYKYKDSEDCIEISLEENGSKVPLV